MSADQQTIAVTMITIGIILVALLFIIFRKRTGQNADDNLSGITVKATPNRGAGILGFLLVLFSIFTLFDFFVAQTQEREIVALLLWIGSCLFWGFFLLANLISKR